MLDADPQPCLLETIFCKEFNTLYLTRFRAYKIARPPPNKKPRRGGELKQRNTCRKVPFTDKFC
jgi:hypothetical protein